MPLNWRMDKENVAHLHIRVILRGKKNNDILNFASKWIELENIILSKVTHTQKDEHGMHSLI